MREYSIKVLGMSCVGCKSSVEAALMRVDGVVSASADLSSGMVSVKAESDSDMSGSLREAVKGAGYSVEESDNPD